jgi:hypothetical protein
MKIPPDSPTKDGQRVQHRGRTPERIGTVLRIVPPHWFWVRWDYLPERPILCHPNELKIVESK